MNHIHFVAETGPLWLRACLPRLDVITTAVIWRTVWALWKKPSQLLFFPFANLFRIDFVFASVDTRILCMKRRNTPNVSKNRALCIFILSAAKAPRLRRLWDGGGRALRLSNDYVCKHCPQEYKLLTAENNCNGPLTVSAYSAILPVCVLKLRSNSPC